MKTLALILLGYLAGSLPSAYWITRRLRASDIRRLGTGNPGAANVFRTVGPAAGIMTLAADILKGYLPTLIAQRLCPDDELAVLLCAAAAIAGHLWMIFLRFEGGKGVATATGVFLALLPAPLAPAVLVAAGAAYFSGHISVGSIAGAASFPLLSLAAGSTPSSLVFAFFACGVILYRHIPNARRILALPPARLPSKDNLDKSGKTK